MKSNCKYPVDDMASRRLKRREADRLGVLDTFDAEEDPGLAGQLAAMNSAFCACIETGILPKVDSSLHDMALSLEWQAYPNRTPRVHEFERVASLIAGQIKRKNSQKLKTRGIPR